MKYLQKKHRNKFVKRQKGNFFKNSLDHFFLRKGVFGMKALECSFITKKQIEILRRYIKRKIKYIQKRKSRLLRIKYWMFFKNFYNITKKPSEIRMGKGKGPVCGKIFMIKRGVVFLEIFSKSNYKFLILILKKISLKLPVKIKIIKKKIN